MISASPVTADNVAATRIRRFMPTDGKAWDAFVLRHPEATFCHRAGWREVLESAFGHDTHYLLAEDEHGLAGVLPLARVRSRLFGDSLSSTPFCVYGGAIARDETTRQLLEDEACRLADGLGVDYLEFRNDRPRRATLARKDQLYVTFRKALDPDPEKNMLAIPRKQRAMVRKGQAAGLVAEYDDDLDRFYAIYSDSVHHHGTPVFSRRYFERLRATFGADCEILTVSRDGRAVASVMSFLFRDEILPYYGGGLTEARECAAFDFMYWEVMRRAVERGVRRFDYGRSKVGTGSYHFKKNWGFTPEPLCYEYHLVRATAIPEVNPLNPKYRMAIDAWKRLPVSVTRIVGPWLARSLG